MINLNPDELNGKREALALLRQTLDNAKAQGLELVQTGDNSYDFINTRAVMAERRLQQAEEFISQLKGAFKALHELVV